MIGGIWLAAGILFHHYSLAAKISAAPSAASPASLVPTSKGLLPFDLWTDRSDPFYAQWASFERPEVPCSAEESDGDLCSSVALSVWPQEWETHGLLPSVYQVLEIRHPHRAADPGRPELCIVGVQSMGFSVARRTMGQVPACENGWNSKSTATTENTQESTSTKTESPAWSVAGPTWTTSSCPNGSPALAWPTAVGSSTCTRASQCCSSFLCFARSSAAQGSHGRAEIAREQGHSSNRCAGDHPQVYRQSQQDVEEDMLSAVDEMSHAREELEAAIAARSNMHAAWRTFLAQSLERFQAYGQDFANQEKDLVVRIQNATEVFNQAKITFNEAKEKATTDPTVVVSDDDAVAADVPMMAPDRIASSLTHLTTSLEALKTQAEDLEKEEQKLKRPRLEAPSEPAAVTPTGSAVPSFG
eukprot:s1056_g13.t1